MGIGWQQAASPGLLGALGLPGRGRLGTFAVLYSRRRFLDTLFAENPTNADESIEHRTGPPARHTAGDGDTESFFARLSRLPPHADSIVFAVSSFDYSTFETAHSAHCRLVDESRGRELARYTFPAHGPRMALILADVTRAAGAEWIMTTLGEPATRTTLVDLLRAIECHG